MKKVFELLGLGKPTEGDFGIEIEAEGENMRAVADNYWHTEADGSLRGNFPESAAEFVLDKPILREQVRPALECLAKAQKDSTLNFSFRTSVHVHVNVQKLNYEHLLNMMYTYYLLEEPLTTYCGRDRKGNRFCLRLTDAEGVLDEVSTLFKGTGVEIGHLNGDAIRYSAMNLAALPKYGSLEFRAMRGNLDVDYIDTWVGALHAIREYAKSKNDPMEIYEEFRKNPPTVFLKTVLGGLADQFIYPRIIRDLQRSFSISLDLPFQYQMAKEIREQEEAERKGRKAAPNKGKVVMGAPVRFAVPPFVAAPRAPEFIMDEVELPADARGMAEVRDRLRRQFAGLPPRD